MRKHCSGLQAILSQQAAPILQKQLVGKRAVELPTAPLNGGSLHPEEFPYGAPVPQSMELVWAIEELKARGIGGSIWHPEAAIPTKDMRGGKHGHLSSWVAASGKASKSYPACRQDVAGRDWRCWTHSSLAFLHAGHFQLNEELLLSRYWHEVRRELLL